MDAVAFRESSYKPDAINREGGGKGAWGLMQVRQAALADYNKANGTSYKLEDLLKPEIGADVGAWYLGQQLDRFNDPVKALIAYKEGPNSQAVAKGSHPYADAVMGRVLGAPAKPQTLPGIPAAAQPTASDDDAILAAFTKGGTLAESGAAKPDSDDAILAAFTKAPVSQAAAPKPAAPAPKAEAPGALEAIGAGLGKGIGSTVLGAQQLLGKGAQAIGLDKAGDWLVNDANQGLRNLESQYAPYSEARPVAAGAGNIAGSILSTLPLAAAAPVARTALGTAGVGAGLSAVTGALTPVSPDTQDFGAEKVKQVGSSALLGGALAPVARAVGGIISPNVSDDVKLLLDKGITPTPGQILGGGFARTESKLTSVPVLGDMIKGGQQRAIADLNKAAYNEALAPIGKTFTGKVGNEGIDKVAKEIGAVYDDVLPKMTLRPDQQFQADVLNLSQMAQGLPKQQQDAFLNIVKNQIFGKMGPQGLMDGQQVKGVQSELARRAKGYLGDPSFDNRELGAAISALRDAVDSNLARTNPPELAKQLSQANEAWANFVRLRTAAASAGAGSNEGVFTAAQLNSAVRQADKSVGKGDFAKGQALMQDLSGAGQRVLGNGYPDSGTVGRGLMALLAPGTVGAGFMTSPTSTLAALSGIGLGSLPYTQPGQRLAAALLTARPQFAKPVGEAISRSAPLFAPAVAPALLPGGQ